MYVILFNDLARPRGFEPLNSAFGGFCSELRFKGRPYL
jgi:hypothetical protein